MKNQLSFQVEDIRFRQKDTGWSVLSARHLQTSEKMIAAGIFHHVKPGVVISSAGQWQNHPVYGKQWLSETFTLGDPQDPKTLVRFLYQVLLSEVTGLGKRTAEKMVEEFADKTLEVLDQNPEKLQKIKGISVKRSQEIHEVWQKHRASKDTLLFLASHGLSVDKSRKILAALSAGELAELKKNPYILLDRVPGLGFRAIDGMARSCGVSLDDPARIRGGIHHLIQNGVDQFGHTCVPEVFLQIKLATFLGLKGDDGFVSDYLQSMADDGELILREGDFQDLDSLKRDLLAPYIADTSRPIRYCYKPLMYFQEQELAERIVAQLAQRKALYSGVTEKLDASTFDAWMAEYKAESGISLNHQQQQAVYLALTEPFFILTGGAGVGKTTTLKAMIWAAERTDLHVGLASPTGRAAQRMKELTGRGAKTLHRLLEWSPFEGSFSRHAEKPLSEDLIVVDECSMVDLTLASALFDALPMRSRIVIMGDPHQLPSVGAGAVLWDLIQSQRIPVITLTEIFRQAAYSPIIRASQAILQGKVPEFCLPQGEREEAKQQLEDPSREEREEEDSSVSWCEYQSLSTPEQIYGQITHLISTRLAHLDALRDIQVLTPMNKGSLGCDGLNHHLQNHFLSQSDSHREDAGPIKLGDFQVGDKVIQTVNNYELGVFNGDIGFVIHREVSKKQVLESLMVQFEDDHRSRAVSYSKAGIVELRLAYAITIHKSQGSEFPAIILPVVWQHKLMMSSHLLYTALTRAKNTVVLLGDAAVVQYALEKKVAPRFTRLRDLVKAKAPDLVGVSDDKADRVARSDNDQPIVDHDFPVSAYSSPTVLPSAPVKSS